MGLVRRRGAGSGLLVTFFAGAALTLLVSAASVRAGATVGLGAVLGIAFFAGAIWLYATRPHIAVAATVFLFAFTPALKLFVRPEIGALKDVVDVAAIIAVTGVCLLERRLPDRRAIAFVLLLLLLYVVNVGHQHGGAWATGVRLTGEPLLLLLAGMALPHPRRTLRWAIVALVAAGAIDGFYGVIQQALGPARLVSLGYSYTAQVRTVGGFLRAFGTFDDPFAFATFLLFAIAAVIFGLRRSRVSYAAGVVLLLGLASSLVRTSALILAAFAALLLIRARFVVPAAFLSAAATIIAVVTLAGAGGTEQTTYTVYSAHGRYQLVKQTAPTGSGGLVLNGRVSAWRAALGSNPYGWLFGRGVGVVGTAAERAAAGFGPKGSSSSSASSGANTLAVDSGYLATVADVGIVGLAVLLGLLGRLLRLAATAARHGGSEGWLAVALLTAMLFDALTRASFTGFPTASVCFLLVGLAIAAAGDRATPAQTGTTRRA